jgi:hypothetical protein
MMKASNPTAKGRWQSALKQVLPPAKQLQLQNMHWVGPFENACYQGLLREYSPEHEIDLLANYDGKAGQVNWQMLPGLGEALGKPVDLSDWLPAEPWSVVFLYAEVEVIAPQIAEVSLGSPGMIWAWVNGDRVLSPMIPRPANLQDNRVWVALNPGSNQLLIKLIFGFEPWNLECYCDNYGEPGLITGAVERIIKQPKDDLTRMMARYTLAEIHAAQGDQAATHLTLEALRSDPFASKWDITWAEMVAYQHQATGSFLPIHDVPTAYDPVSEIEAHPTFWPKSPSPAQELLVVDLSQASPQEEFALSVLQGLVNREQPRLYLLHTRYDRQDRQWLEELHFTGYRSQEIAPLDAWDRFRNQIQGAILYDGSIMDEIGDFHSDRLNQTNVLMMIGALENAVPLTPEMNARLQLPVIFEARGKWSSQYEMMRWAYQELFPLMDQRILATNYPGIFLLTDYLVAFKIFTFWFPEHRVLPEENLLNGILASTPPNTPIVGWWFDWMPDPKDPDLRHADAVMEEPGLLHGSAFGKVLTPSHEATNLSVHSGVPAGSYQHKAPEVPEFDPSKIYYAFILSDGDNLGEALMMRTRDLQWDKPERGSIPVGWSFAPAAARLAPPVLNYYLRTATPNDLLVGGLGVGYTEPMIYLRAYPEQRDDYYQSYTCMTDDALGWIDSSCLWLINGGDEEEDRYAQGSSGQLQGIFTGYGGAPEMAQARITAKNVAAFRSATRLLEGQPEEVNLEAMVSDLQAAAGAMRPAFLEAWVLNWDWRMDMLQEVQRRLGPDFVCVRPDVLVQLRQQWVALNKDHSFSNQG